MSEAAKSDEHLYRELKWLVPTTCLSTYVTSGKWQRDLLEVDLALIKERLEGLKGGNHRRSCGQRDVIHLRCGLEMSKH